MRHEAASDACVDEMYINSLLKKREIRALYNVIHSVKMECYALFVYKLVLGNWFRRAGYIHSVNFTLHTAHGKNKRVP